MDRKKMGHYLCLSYRNSTTIPNKCMQIFLYPFHFNAPKFGFSCCIYYKEIHSPVSEGHQKSGTSSWLHFPSYTCPVLFQMLKFQFLQVFDSYNSVSVHEIYTVKFYFVWTTTFF